jgi:vesicle-fusing ATPase
MAIESDFPFVRLITPRICHGATESSICAALFKAFDDAYRSPVSLIFIDNIESIIGFSPVGLRYSSVIMQTLKDLCMSRPPNPLHKIFILATTAAYSFLESNDLDAAFPHRYLLPKLSALEDFLTLVKQVQAFQHKSTMEQLHSMLAKALELCQPKFDIPLKRFFDVLTDAMLLQTDEERLAAFCKSMAALNLHLFG